MKKFISVFVVLFAALTTTLLASCSKDDDKNKVGTTVISLTLEPNDDLLTLLDLSVVYTDGNGQTKTEAVTKKFYKSFTISKYPASGSISLKATPKSNYEKGKYSPSLTYTYEAGSSLKTNILNTTKKIDTDADLQSYADRVNKLKWSWNFLADGSQAK